MTLDTPPPRRAALGWISIAALMAAGLLAGCGGVIDDGQGFVLPATPSVLAQPAAESADTADQTAATQATTLEGDPAAMPADHAARTRAGLYLKRAAAVDADRRFDGKVVWLDVGCCAGESADLAVLVAYGVQAAANLDNDVPFFVTGADLRLAARVVDRLLAEGNRRPYLVTP